MLGIVNPKKEKAEGEQSPPPPQFFQKCLLQGKGEALVFCDC